MGGGGGGGGGDGDIKPLLTSIIKSSFLIQSSSAGSDGLSAQENNHYFPD